MKKIAAIVLLILLSFSQKADAAYPVTFGTLTGGNQSLSLFDTMFGVVGTMGQVMCSASGPNTIALTPNANMPTITSYANYRLFGFVAASSSTGSVTVNVSGVGALPLYLSDGVTQAASGALASGVYYIIVYNSALNSSAGGFQLVTSSSTIPTGGTANQFLQTNGSNVLSWASTPIVLTGGSAGNTIPQNATNYMWNGFGAGINAANTPLAIGGTIKNFTALSANVIPVGQSTIMTVEKNGSDTSVTCTLNNATSVCLDSTHTATFGASDGIAIKVVTSATTGAMTYQFSLEETIP